MAQECGGSARPAINVSYSSVSTGIYGLVAAKALTLPPFQPLTSKNRSPPVRTTKPSSNPFAPTILSSLTSAPRVYWAYD